ncbi:polysaccharide deacetylase family protein [Bacillus tuaregi]|uniref:polysaccharide deacetylase family protein n=1 Tax=Bacillus tuaregi TaxID=1816695 RepID=UPI0008F83FBA|nr:polysaccharide deacetylase family protein [Bacillus tuaregi]
MYDLQDNRWVKNSNQIKPTEKKVVLTFDDGPSRSLTAILDILKEKDVKAIFFWQSRLVHKQRPWKRVLLEGHKIGSHAQNHKNLVKLCNEQQYQQIKGSVEKINNMTGAQVQFFRPPFGQYNEYTMSVLKELQLVPMLWEISSFDWELKHNPDKIICNVVNHLMDGSVILLHELEQTVAILPQLIDKIREHGYEFTVI